jgi:hypothetical protein
LRDTPNGSAISIADGKPWEREFSFLKRQHVLATISVRGLERVQPHVELTMLARLALATHHLQTMPVAA